MKKVVIIGAGPAGLAAALELQKQDKDISVTVLEGSDRIGGISQTVRWGGNRMDIGGHRFFSKSQEVMDWWSDLMPIQGSPSFDDKLLGREKPLAEGGPDPETEDNVMLLRERVSRIYYDRKFFDYPISLKPATIRDMGLITTAKAGFSYIGSCIFKKPETNLENFYINRFGKVLYSMFFEGYTEKLWGRHPREISAEWGAQRVKGLSVRAVLADVFRKVFHIKSAKVETSLIEQFWYPKYGPGQLWERAAELAKKNGAELLMNYRVKSVMLEGNKIKALICDTPDGERMIVGDVFVSSMPVKDLVGAMEGSEVCPKIRKIAKGLPYRDFVTVGLLVNKLDLVNKTGKKTLGNIVPDCWIYVQDKGVKLGRIQIFNNWSPYMVKDPENTVWIGLEYFCAEGDSFWNMSEKECVAFAVKELVKMGVIKKKAVLGAHREKVKKAYPAYFDTYKHFDKVVSFLDRFDNLFCIGRNGQHRYNNMDHSMLTGIYAARAIAEGRTDKSDIWNVNTEKEYHEEKSK
ncbi:MAG: NAD(P)/FAD-dependent oxidoreductase [Ruminococcus sp.]|nr:NAD(P)/FAD-dependent oxidoreductase [Ruminococcus sp.]